MQGVEGKTQFPPEELLLDGQQRITSIYQVAMRGEVVETTTIKHKKIKRWFYVDIRKAIDPNVDMNEAIFTMPEDKKLKVSEKWPQGLDLTTQAQEFENLIFPVSMMFDWSAWQTPLITYLNKNGRFDELWTEVIVPFDNQFIKAFKSYNVPVISLDKSTSKEAVCIVFEKVNTGGKALDAFELVTAMYAAEGYKLRDDWYGDGKEIEGYESKISVLNSIGANKEGVLSKVSNTDFLQVISLFYTHELRRSAISAGKHGKDLPQVTGKRGALLNLPLVAYKKYRDNALMGFERAANFLHMMNIYRVRDLPYQTQVIPLAAILIDIGNNWENSAVREKMAQWYWCGVFGELYGSAVDTRIGTDFMEVPKWLEGGQEPKTVLDANFHRDRLLTMRMRLSAAYKGVNALLMKEGARDFRSGQDFMYANFFDEAVDIHHIFPKKWCAENGKNSKDYDSIVNKSPLSARTNRIIGGDAPSIYLKSLELGAHDFQSVASNDLNHYIETHLADPVFLRDDDYEGFMKTRQNALLSLIEKAMKKTVNLQGPDDESWGDESF